MHFSGRGSLLKINFLILFALTCASILRTRFSNYTLYIGLLILDANLRSSVHGTGRVMTSDSFSIELAKFISRSVNRTLQNSLCQLFGTMCTMELWRDYLTWIIWFFPYNISTSKSNKNGVSLLFWIEWARVLYSTWPTIKNYSTWKKVHFYTGLSKFRYQVLNTGKAGIAYWDLKNAPLSTSLFSLDVFLLALVACGIGW